MSHLPQDPVLSSIYIARRLGRIPFREHFNIGGLDEASVFITQKIFQQHLQRKRKPRSCADCCATIDPVTSPIMRGPDAADPIASEASRPGILRVGTQKQDKLRLQLRIVFDGGRLRLARGHF